MERLKFGNLFCVCLSSTGENSAGQLESLDTFPKKRLNYFVISTPGFGYMCCVFQDTQISCAFFYLYKWLSTCSYILFIVLEINLSILEHRFPIASC